MVMGKRTVGLVVLLVVGMWVLVGVTKGQAAARAQVVAPLTLTDSQNADYRTTYTVSRTVTLTAGVFADEATGLQIVLTDDYAFGDLDGDGVADAAAILAATVQAGEPSPIWWRSLPNPDDRPLAVSFCWAKGSKSIRWRLRLKGIKPITGGLSVKWLTNKGRMTVDEIKLMAGQKVAPSSALTRKFQR